jgi:hypothetical protein
MDELKLFSVNALSWNSRTGKSGATVSYRVARSRFEAVGMFLEHVLKSAFKACDGWDTPQISALEIPESDIRKVLQCREEPAPFDPAP